MIIKHDHTTNPAANACGNCSVEERRLLHHVRHRGIFRRLCPTCVLRLHPQSFCPTCFQVYPPSPPHDSVITCSKCYSSSHSYCITSSSSASPGNHYICPLCVNPSSPIFNLKKATEANVVSGGEGLDVSGNSEVYRVIDETASKILLAAAKIAASSMSKAAVAARAEAERRAKEAAFTRKRAREALEYVSYLVVKEKVRKKEAAPLISPEVPTPSAGEIVPHLVGGGGNVGNLGGGIVQVARENYTNVNNSNGARSENVDGGVHPVAVVEQKTNSTRNVAGVDNSGQVVAELDAVEVRENEKMGGTKVLDEVSGELSNDNCVPMDVDNNRGMRLSSRSNDGESLFEKNSVGGSEESAAEDHNLCRDKMEEAIEGMVLVPHVEDQMPHKENNEGHHNNGTQQ